MTSLRPWKILHSEMALDHEWYKVRQDTVELPDGTIIDDYFVSVRPDVVICFALTPAQEVVCVRQYKHGAQAILTELPAGTIEKGETAEEAAKRELQEETGFRAAEMRKIGTLYSNPTKNTNQVHVCFADGLENKGNQEWDVTENIQVVKFPVAEIMQRIMDGTIAVPESIACISMGLQKLQIDPS